MDKNRSITVDGGGIFGLYFVSIIWIPLGAIWPSIMKWRTWSKKSKIGIFFNHIARVFCFIVPVIAGYTAGSIGVNLSIIVPLFILSLVALMLIFPTRKRWKKWSNWTSLLD